MACIAIENLTHDEWVQGSTMQHKTRHGSRRSSVSYKYFSLWKIAL